MERSKVSLYAKSREKGEMLEGVLILIALFCIIVFFILPQKGIVGPENNFTSLTQKRPVPYDPNGTSPVPTDSAYSKSINLDSGNARYSYDPLDEYITIRNIGRDPINISGWKLVNGKGSRTYANGDQTVSYPSDEVIIPQAAGYLSTTGVNIAQSVVLEPGEQALINTGSVGVTSPYKMVSFKENECSGYLVGLHYDLTPPLSRLCVRPGEEPGFKNLDSSCKDYVNRLGSCTTPTLNDSTVITSQCRAFVQEHFTYAGCVAAHKDDPNFYKDTWRIFLGRKWELWDKSDEEIKLFDQFGKLVDYVAY